MILRLLFYWRAEAGCACPQGYSAFGKCHMLIPWGALFPFSSVLTNTTSQAA